MMKINGDAEMANVDNLVNDFEKAIRNRVNDMDGNYQNSFGFGYLLGYVKYLAMDNPQVLQDLQLRVDLMKGE